MISNVQHMPTRSLDWMINPLLVWSPSCGRNIFFIYDYSLECPSSGDAMKPEGGCRSGRTTSSSVRGIGV